MLEYLYTLAKPNFDKPDDLSHERAEGAFIMSDKYDLDALREHGREKLLSIIQNDISSWGWAPTSVSDMFEEVFITRIERLWELQQNASSAMRTACLGYLCQIPTVLRDSRRFQSFMEDNPVFRAQFVNYILSNIHAWRAEKPSSSWERSGW